MSVSEITWFYVGNQEHDQDCSKVLSVEYTDTSIPQLGFSESQVVSLNSIVMDFSCNPDRTNMKEKWKKKKDEIILDKLIISFMSHLTGDSFCFTDVAPGNMSAQTFIENLHNTLSNWDNSIDVVE